MPTKKVLPTIIALDPSIVSSGICLFRYGDLLNMQRIRPKKTDPDNRLEQIAQWFRGYLQALNSEKEVVLAIEAQYRGGVNTNAILKVAEVVGVLKGIFLYWARESVWKKYLQSYSIMDIHPMTAKKAIGVTKRLKRKESKKEVMRLAQNRYPEAKIKHQDIADAVAIGVAAMNVEKNLAKSKK